MTSMKLRNLFLASLAICAMASCSEDENGPSVPQEVDAYLNIAAVSDMKTKSSTETSKEKGELKEQVVNTLTAYLFTNDDAAKYVIHKTVTVDDADAVTTMIGEEKSITAIKGIHVKVEAPAETGGTSATKFKVVLLANATLGAVADLAALNEKETVDITTFTTIGGHYLPMHSNKDGLLVAGIKPYDPESQHLQNWYAAGTCVTQTVANDAEVTIPTGAGEIVMYRSIARVQIESLNTAFTGQYSNATFNVDSIYLANVRATATVMGEENSDASYYRGAPETFEVIQGLIDPTENAVKDGYLKIYPEGLSLSSNAVTTGIDFSKYIYANKQASSYQTRLILAGDIIVDGVSRHKYFHIPLADAAGENVVSNKIYKITATITGEGNDKPDEILDNACINFKITVEKWTVVDQNEGDLN